ncbi:MAG: hypothetical protein LBV41_03350 [Cytophagaceae bacterium]|jgi:hypothetical protein|nr:hypothetical protein [Cytophagaceae bacterium]
MAFNLHDGHTVRLDGLGLLSVSTSSDGFDTECTPRRVKAKKICFRAAPKLKADLKYIRFEREK